MFRQLLSLFFVMGVLTAGAALASGGSGGGGGGTGTTCNCVSLAVSKEQAPPGSLHQMKVFVTEPKPISTGTGNFTFSAYDSLVGISLSSHSQDAVGVAVVRGSAMNLSVISPLSTFGDVLDYPILTVAGHVPAGTPLSTKFALNVDPNSLQFYDPSGVLYPVGAKNGQLVANNVISIGDVTPGSAVVPAGGVVTITGANFVPGTTVKFAEASIAQVKYVSSTRLDVTLGTTANMHGMMIKASNPDGSSDTYFSYQRTAPMAPSADPVLQLAMPLLPPHEVTSATIAFPAPAASTTYGVALQNIEFNDAVATVELLDASGATLASTQVTVSATHFTVRELGELFGAAPAGAATVRVTSALPVEVMGMAANQATGTAAPIIAQ